MVQTWCQWQIYKGWMVSIYQSIWWYMILLDFKSGLPYMSIRPNTTDEWENPPHLILTCDKEWNPQFLTARPMAIMMNGLMPSQTWMMNSPHPYSMNIVIITSDILRIPHNYKIKTWSHSSLRYMRGRYEARSMTMSPYVLFLHGFLQIKSNVLLKPQCSMHISIWVPS